MSRSRPMGFGLGPLGEPKYWFATGIAFGVVMFSTYTHTYNRKMNRMIEQQYWTEDENKMHGYFRIKNLERAQLMEDDDEWGRLKLLDAGVKRYPFGLNPRRNWRKHSLLYHAKMRGKLPVEWEEGDPWPWEKDSFKARFPDFEVAPGPFGKLRIGYAVFGPILKYDRMDQVGPENQQRLKEEREFESRWGRPQPQ